MRTYAVSLGLLFLLFTLLTGTSAIADPGDLDPTFGDSGIVILDVMDESDFATSPDITSDGKIVVAGYHLGSNDWDFMVVRYKEDGSLDSTFSEDGIVITDYAGYRNEWIDAKVQPDDRFLAVGAAYNATDSDIAIGRYNTDGTFDPGFADNGLLVTGVGAADDWLVGVDFQADEKIVAIGSADNGTDFDCLLIRLNSDGTLDTSFSDDGILIIDLDGKVNHGSAVEVQPDGRIVVVGRVEREENDEDIFLMRLLSDGTPDSSFSEDGLVITDIGNVPNLPWSVALQANGKIVVDGQIGPVGEQDILVLRYNADGSLDPAFSGDGIVTLDIAGYYDGGRGVRVQEDGSLVVNATMFDGVQYDYALVRFNCDGSLDSSFSDDGIAITDINEYDGSYYLVLQPDGKIVVTGYIWDNHDYDWVVMRYEGGVLPGLSISPPSGKYVTTQKFDLALIVETAGLSVVGGYAELDNTDVTSVLMKSVKPGTLVTGGMTFRMPDIHTGVLTPGCHMLEVGLDLSNGSRITDSVTWEVRENTEP